MKTPVVESTGTGGGMKLFCAGVGEDHPDFTNASRQIKKSEFEDCAKNGVTEIVEIKIGFDGLSVAHSKSGHGPRASPSSRFSWRSPRKFPDADGKLVANPYKMWSDIDPSLPAEKIEVLGPPPTSGTRDSFAELVMEQGAATIDSLKELKKADAKAFEKVWKSMREDGAYVEAGENDNLIVQKLEANPDARRHLRLFLPRGEREHDQGHRRSTVWRRAMRRSPAANTRCPARSSSMPRSSMSAPFPAWPNSSPNMFPTRRSAKTAISPPRAL